MNVVPADGRLLAAIGDHFKHLSVAMTERSYIGRDPELLGLVDDMGVREAARMLYEAATGKTIMTGRMAATVAVNAPDIVRQACDDEGDDEKVDRVKGVLKQDDLRVWPSDWGQCLFRPETARCHLSRVLIDPTPVKPDYTRRHPGVCCDCANLLVAGQHATYCRERRDENLVAAEQLSAEGEREAAWTARKRARKAAPPP